MAILAMLGLPGGAAYADETDGHTIVVKSGQSIQAAIDKAAPGSTIRVQRGVYHESMLVQKPLTLKGDGAELLPPTTLPSHSPCTEGAGTPVSGICVAGEVTKPLHGVTITGFEVEKFPGSGIWGIYTDGLRLLKNRTLGNGGYGIFSLRSTQSLIANNLATESDEAGIYVGESPIARARVTGNVVTGNLFGLFLRDSTLITAEENRASGNCVGILALNTGGGAGNYLIRDNQVTANTKSCTSGLPVSGLGIVLAGTSDVRVTGNRVTDNKPKPRAPSLFVGGIAVISSVDPTQPGQGGANAVNNEVIENTALRNKPFDLFYDDHTGTGNVFRENRCETSSPPGLCRSGNGDHGNSGN
jgi:parallel beta-helix repeat protein